MPPTVMVVPFRVLPPAVMLSVAVTLVKLGLSTVATVSLLPAWVTAMFLPASKVTVSPGLTCSTVVPLTLPAEALLVRSKPRVAALATAYNWLPLIASKLVAVT